MKKEAVANLGEEEMAFLKHVRLTRNETRRDANALFSTAHQTRERDQALLNKLFIQTPAVISTSHSLLKEASAEEFETYEKIKIAYNVFHFFDSGSDVPDVLRRYPELHKVAALKRPAMSLKAVPSATAATGSTANSSLTSGAAT